MKSSYNNVYTYNIDLMKRLIEIYGEGHRAWEEFRKHYIDPDNYPVDIRYNSYKGIICTVDGLLSINRIYQHEGFGKKFIETYTKYRRTPIIFFPSEKNGINMSRYSVFGDRIDHTLFDLKNRLSKDKNRIEDCKLFGAYNKPKTKKWLAEIDSFEKYIDWHGMKGVFTNDNYEVFDLEENNGVVLENYRESYDKKWSKAYYSNVKKKIELFEKQQNEYLI